MRLMLLILATLLLGCKSQPEDRFTIIRGKSQHILDMGSGKPAVVFVSGFGDRVSSWMRIQPEISKTSRTLSYDRAGLGESAMLGTNRSLDSVIHELGEILEAENIRPPYILVGHSYGGHFIRYYADKYPERVAGLLLVDATVEFMEEEFKRVKTPAEIRSYDSLIKHGRDPNWTEGVNKEADYFAENNNRMKNIRFNPAIPTTVITATETPPPSLKFLHGVDDMKVVLHKRWASQSPHIRHVFAIKSGHYVQLDEPELVITELKSLIEIARQGGQ